LTVRSTTVAAFQGATADQGDQYNPTSACPYVMQYGDSGVTLDGETCNQIVTEARTTLINGRVIHLSCGTGAAVSFAANTGEAILGAPTTCNGASFRWRYHGAKNTFYPFRCGPPRESPANLGGTSGLSHTADPVKAVKQGRTIGLCVRLVNDR